MKYLIVFILICINHQLLGQSFNGYYEAIDENGKILERLILTGDEFEKYIIYEGILNIGIGNLIIKKDSLIFNYKNHEPFKVYRIIYKAYGRKKSKLSIICKIDTLNFTDQIQSYKFLLHDKSNREFNITNGFTTLKADTIKINDITFITDDIIKKIEPAKDCFKHVIIIEFDNTKTKYIDEMIQSYRILHSEDKMFVLQNSNNPELIYFKNKENEKDFRDYINMKNDIEYKY